MHCSPFLFPTKTFMNWDQMLNPLKNFSISFIYVVSKNKLTSISLALFPGRKRKNCSAVVETGLVRGRTEWDWVDFILREANIYYARVNLGQMPGWMGITIVVLSMNFITIPPHAFCLCTRMNTIDVILQNPGTATIKEFT